MKKIKLLLPILVLILFLSFSFLMRPSVNAATILETPATDEAKVARSLENIKNNMPSKAIASFPVAYIGGFGETIEFSSDAPTVIDVSHINETEGWVIVHRDAVTEENKKVTITITVTLNEKSAAETKEVVVPMGTTNSQKFNVTYDGVVESEHSNVKEHTAGNYVKLIDASRDGYIFDGWFINNKKVTCLPVGIYKDITVTAKFTLIKLESIEITTQPTKLTYTAFEEFDKTGLVVTAKYNDNSTKDVTASVSIDKTTLTGSDSVVKVSYNEGGVTKDATIDITVNKILVTTPKVENKYSYEYNGKTHSVEIKNTDSSKYSITYEGTNSLTNVGSESVKVKFVVTDSTNYELDKTEFNTTLEVTKKQITIVVDDKTSVYGAKLNDLTCTITGLVEGESLEFDLTKADGINVGTYDITISQKSDENYTNYKFDLTGLKGTYTITKAQLKVTPDPITINLGAHLPEFTVKFDGFINSENESVLSGSLTSDIEEKVNVNMAGTYKYTITGYTSENYEIVFVEGTVVVNETTVDIELEETTSEYDGTIKNIIPVFKDGENTVNPKTVDYTYSKDGLPVKSIKDAGTYTILVSFEDDTLGKGSKEFTYIVKKKNVTITVNEQRFEYTGSIISFNTTDYTSTLDNEDLGIITVLLKASSVEPKDLGSYELTVSYAENPNYEVTVIEGTLIIFLSDNDKVNKAADELDSKYSTVLTGTIYDIDDLIVKAYEANIEWSSGNTLISIDRETGKVTITKGKDDQIEVVLTAKISSGEEWTTRNYSFTFSFVREKGTEENPYTASEAYDAACSLEDGAFSDDKVYVSGNIKTVTYSEEYSNYEIVIIDTIDSSKEFKLFRATIATDLNKEDVIVGVEILAYGYLQKYVKDSVTTPELGGSSSKDYPIIQSITLSNEVKLAAAKTQVETELNKYTSLTTAPTDKLIVSAKYSAIVTYLSNNPTVLSISEDGTITVNPSEESNTDVTVTYTISLDGSSLSGTKTITVKKAGSVTLGPNEKYTLEKDTYSSIISTYENAKLKLSISPTYIAWDSNTTNNRGLQLGSNKKPMNQFTITADYTDAVSTVKVTVTTGGNATLSISVGGVALNCGTATSISVTTTSTEYTFAVASGSVLTGDVVISVNASSKAFYILSVEIN